MVVRWSGGQLGSRPKRYSALHFGRPDVHSNPLNIYTLPATQDLAKLKHDIMTAMTEETFLTVPIAGGSVVISGATVPFVMLCP
jgi:hypothetical protein